jgi:hypothetical protein
MPYSAIRVLLAAKFGVLPKDIDEMKFPEVADILAVFDGEAKATSVGT